MKKAIYICELERFGYTLRCVSETEKGAVNKVMQEYTKAYKSRNGGQLPGHSYERDYMYGGHGTRSDYAIAKEECRVWQTELDKVEWD